MLALGQFHALGTRQGQQLVNQTPGAVDPGGDLAQGMTFSSLDTAFYDTANLAGGGWL